MDKVGLVLQGGGIRGVYTSGVIDFFLDKGIRFPYVIAVSAGACNGAAYISGQRGVGKNMHDKYVRDKRFMGLRNLYRDGSFFGMDFIFDEVPRKFENFDFDAFNSAEQDFIVVATDCISGKPVYLRKNSCSDMFKAIRASSSLPFLAKKVSLDGLELLDGGMGDPIPIKKSMEDGNDKNVVILTGRMEHQRKPRLIPFMAKRFYPEHSELKEAICNGYNLFNETLDFIDELSRDKRAYVIQPSKDIRTRLIERNSRKLNMLYELGYMDGENAYEDIISYLNS